MKKLWNILKISVKEWGEDKAPRLAAALAYYTIFSIPPLLVIVIAIAGLFLGREAVSSAITGQISGLIGPESAEAISEMIATASQTGTGIWATIIGVVLLLLGASGVFGQLQDALNTIWEVKPEPNRGVMDILKNRVFSFAIVISIGFLLLVSLVVTAALGALGDYFNRLYPGFEPIMQVVNFIVSFLVITLLFALLFKFVPDAKIAWKDVWLGAAVTSLLFTIGRTAIGLYLGNSQTASNFGAASSVILILLWVYYSSQILFFGAEVTQVYANEYGEQIIPKEGATRVTEEDRAQEGLHSGSERSGGKRPLGTAKPVYSRSQAMPGVIAGEVQPEMVPITGVEGHAMPRYRPNLQPSPLRVIQSAMPMLTALLVGVLGSVMLVREEKKQLTDELLKVRQEKARNRLRRKRKD